MMSQNLKQWFTQPRSTLTYEYNPPALSPNLMGETPPEPTPQPQPMYNLGSYWTPFRVLFNRPKNTLTGN